MLVNPINPKIITIITTYKCSAACRECCFQCSPKISVRLSYEEIKNFIEKSVESFGETLKICVFTGGECTLLGEDLFKSIRFAKNMGLRTRIVTNGYWAKTKMSAEKMILKLVNAGLDEINYSTGDNHQEWVSFSTIKNAVLASTAYKLLTFVSIESFSGAKFTKKNFEEDEELNELMDKSMLNVMSTSWISLKNEDIIKKSGKKLDNNYNYSGCDSILNFLGLDPYNKIVACCGLTMEYIPSMKLGEFKDKDLKKLHYEQFNDFMKIWIFVEGAEKVLYYASQKNNKLVKYIQTIVHPCQACAYIYNSKEIRETLFKYYHEVFDSVILKYENKRKQYYNQIQQYN